MKQPGLAVFLVCVCGCAASYPMTVSTDKPLTAKPPTCQFQVVAMPPQSGYEEIATLRLGAISTDNPDTFKDAVRADVCRVGGDLVVEEINGHGAIVRGAVLRKTQ